MAFLPKQVNAVLAIDQESVNRNIEENVKNIPTWLDAVFYPNGFESYIISAGPSMEKYVTELNLKERMAHPNRGFVVFCVKHALPRLMEMGIEPDFCVILDGRPLNADSTHGVNRKSLFEKIPERTIFMVASMSHPDYAKYLMSHGARVIGWHTAVNGIEEFRKKGIVKDPIINGGTSSGTRCIGISMALGIREITLVGFDSCIHNPTKEQLDAIDSKGRPKYMPVDMPLKNLPEFTPEQTEAMVKLEKTFDEVGYHYSSQLAKRYWTTGELLAQAQDFEVFFTNGHIDAQFKVFDDGLVSHMFNNIPNKATRSYSFIEYFRSAVPRKDRSKYPQREVKVGKVRKRKATAVVPPEAPNKV